MVNSVDTDQTLNPVASDLGLHYFLSLLFHSRVITVIHFLPEGEQIFSFKGSSQLEKGDKYFP